MSDDIRIEYMALDDLMTRFHPRNPKAHDIGAIITSIQEFGYIAPGALDEASGLFVEGHGRTEALDVMRRQQMAIPDRIKVGPDGKWMPPVIRGITFKNEAQVLSYIVADNRLTELGGWDDLKLASVLQELVNDDDAALLAATGYDTDDLDNLLRDLAMEEEPSPDPGAQVDKAEELREQWQTERGQLWVIPSATGKGEHRILCGDSTAPQDVARLMGGVKADAVVTDPPYGDNWKAPRWRTSNAAKPIANDHGDEFITTIRDAFSCLIPFVKSPSFAWVFAHGGRKIEFALTVANLASPFYKLNNIAVWDKGDLGMGQLLRNQWESILLLACGDNITEVWHGGHSMSNVFTFTQNRNTEHGHPTPKPVELMVELIRAVAHGDVYDPFLGSGTTAIAAEQTGRLCFGLEIDPGYTAVCLQRMADMGLEPRLEAQRGT